MLIDGSHVPLRRWEKEKGKRKIKNRLALTEKTALL